MSEQYRRLRSSLGAAHSIGVILSEAVAHEASGSAVEGPHKPCQNHGGDGRSSGHSVCRRIPFGFIVASWEKGSFDCVTAPPRGEVTLLRMTAWGATKRC